VETTISYVHIGQYYYYYYYYRYDLKNDYSLLIYCVSIHLEDYVRRDSVHKDVRSRAVPSTRVARTCSCSKMLELYFWAGVLDNFFFTKIC